MNSIFAMLCVALIAVVTGCGKDEGESANARTERLLRAATWKISFQVPVAGHTGLPS